LTPTGQKLAQTEKKETRQRWKKKENSSTKKKIEIKMISPVSPQSLLPIPFDGMAKQEIQLQTFCKAFSQRKKEES